MLHESRDEENPLLSEQEAALYDRQIRIWGADAQKRMGKSSLLVVGVTAAVSEVCKNVVLAGIGSLTIMDDSPVCENSEEVTFLIPATEVGEFKSKKTVSQVCAESLQDFNPMVKIFVQQGKVNDQPEDFLTKFDAILAAHTFIADMKKWNSLCRSSSHKVSFFTVDCRWGWGRIFQDLGNHQYLMKGKEKEPPETLKFCSLEEATSVAWKLLPRKTPALFFAFQVVESWEQKVGKQKSKLNSEEILELLEFKKEMAAKNGLDPSVVPDSILRDLVDSESYELAPSAAILGGLLGQEILRAVSGKGKPFLNFLVFDHNSQEGRIVNCTP